MSEHFEHDNDSDLQPRGNDEIADVEIETVALPEGTLPEGDVSETVEQVSSEHEIVEPTTPITLRSTAFEQEAPTQAFPATPATPTPPSFVVGGGNAEPAATPAPTDPVKKRKRWPIVVAILAVIALIAGIGGAVYAHKHSEALLRCRTAVTDFSDARKALLATADESPAIQRFIRNVLGVDDMLNAVADAASAAEGTVSEQGCATNATITQLNLVANTLNSATDSLKKSTQEMNDKANAEISGLFSTENLQQGASDAIDSTAEGLASAKSGLEDAIARGRSLLTDLHEKYENSQVGQWVTNTLQDALDKGQELIDSSGIKDSAAYETAESAINSAIDAVERWLNS